MKYASGEDVRLWDRVEVWEGCRGFVVFVVDTGEYSPQFPKEQWSYLTCGVMVDTSEGGLIHYPEMEKNILLLGRGAPATPAEIAALRRDQFTQPDTEWRNGRGPTVQIGALNPNGQICTGHRGIRGTDHMQYAYRMECGWCGHVYGANGSDTHERLCPKCQSGAPGIAY